MNIYMIIRKHDFGIFLYFFCFFVWLNNETYLVKPTLDTSQQVQKLREIITYRLIPNLHWNRL